MPELVVPERIHSFPTNTSLEGPAWCTSEQALYFSVQAGDFGTYRWTGSAGVEKVRDYTNKVNGNVFDLQGRLIVCESGNRQVVRFGLDGEKEILAAEFEGRPLNEPNDVVVKSDGSIWFTTPTWSSGELAYQYVLRLDPETGGLKKMVSGIDKPNGLGFSPDESVFYLNDNGANRVLAYAVQPDGSLAGSPQVMLGNIARWPDGMAVDAEGNLFVAVYSGSMAGIQVLSRTGDRLGEIKFFGISDGITNCTFGNPGEHILWVTAKNELYRVDLSAAYPPAQPDLEAEQIGSAIRLTWETQPGITYTLVESGDLQTWTAYSPSPAGNTLLISDWAPPVFWRVFATRE